MNRPHIRGLKFDHIGIDTAYHCLDCGHHHCAKCKTCHRCGCTEYIVNSTEKRNAKKAREQTGKQK